MGKLIAKLLLKAMIPLVLVVGFMSYTLYMKGGDPGAIFGNVFNNALQSAKSSVQDAGQSVREVADPDSSKTTVYKWVDANGVTQFGSRPPVSGNAKTLTIDNNANTFAAQKPLKRHQQQPQRQQNQLSSEDLGMGDQALPGVAGMNLPTDMDPDTLGKFLQSMQSE